MSAAKKIAIVVTIQLIVLLSVIAFNQYTIRTGETVILKLAPVDPRDLVRGDYVTVSYEISSLDTSELPGDDDLGDRVYVELRDGDEGYWEAVAVHDSRTSTFNGTVLIRGKVDFDRFTSDPNEISVRYGIEDIFIPEGSGSDIPWGGDETVAARVKVDRFGRAVVRDLLVDGEPLDLKRR